VRNLFQPKWRVSARISYAKPNIHLFHSSLLQTGKYYRSFESRLISNCRKISSNVNLINFNRRVKALFDFAEKGSQATNAFDIICSSLTSSNPGKKFPDDEYESLEPRSDLKSQFTAIKRSKSCISIVQGKCCSSYSYFKVHQEQEKHLSVWKLYHTG
jgi:hypothetical protein